MYSYEQILKQVNTKCSLNQASAFEFPLLLPIYWSKNITQKKGFFPFIGNVLNLKKKSVQTLSEYSQNCQKVFHIKNRLRLQCRCRIK